MGFSLPRFNLIPWTKRQELVIDKLLCPSESLPLTGDRWLCLYSRLVRAGQELCFHFSINGIGLKFLSSPEQTETSAIPHEFFGDYKNMEYLNAAKIIKLYGGKLLDIISELGYIDVNTLTVKENSPREANFVLFVFFQILITTHDNFASWSFCKLSAQTNPFDSPIGKGLYTQITDFGASCQAYLRCYIKILEQNPSLPSPYHCRGIHVLVSLMRSQVLVSSSSMSPFLRNNPPIDFNLRSIYSEMLEVFLKSQSRANLTITDRFGQMLDAFSEWMDSIESGGENLRFQTVREDTNFKEQKLLKENASYSTRDNVRDWGNDSGNYYNSSNDLEYGGLFVSKIPENSVASNLAFIKHIFREADAASSHYLKVLDITN